MTSQLGAAPADLQGVKRSAWLWWLVAGALPAAVYPFVPDGPFRDGVVYDLPAVVLTVVLAVAVRRRRPARPLLWYLVLAGQAASAVGDCVYDYVGDVLHVDPYPSAADLLYVLSYPLTVAGLMVLIRARTRGRDRVGLIDAAIVSTALGLPAWTFLLRPISATDHAGLVDLLLSVAYPVLDVLLIAMTARMATAPGARNLPAYQMLMLAQVVRLVPDMTFSVTSLTGAEFDWFDGVWLLTYALTAAAALHPSMHRVDEPVQSRETTLSTPRLTLLTGASLLAPAVLAEQGLTNPTKIDWLGVTAGSTILFLLVVARMRLLLAQVHRQARQLDSLAHLDGLTGVPNRRSWDEALTHELAAARRSGATVVAGLVDLDYFKRFNDTYGHQAGDLLLKEAAAVWRAQLRDADRLARYGGEEFGLLLTGLPAAEARDIVERLRAVTPRGQTFSAGLAEWDGTEDADALLRRADEALYRAKETGRDRIELHSSGVTRSLSVASTVSDAPVRRDEGEDRGRATTARPGHPG
jgi:diguanylate cyclase (GGDEF)-like protein